MSSLQSIHETCASMTKHTDKCPAFWDVCHYEGLAGFANIVNNYES
jgi:hypothetical protein